MEYIQNILVILFIVSLSLCNTSTAQSTSNGPEITANTTSFPSSYEPTTDNGTDVDTTKTPSTDNGTDVDTTKTPSTVTPCSQPCVEEAQCLYIDKKHRCVCKPFYLGDGTRCIHQDYIIIVASCVGGGIIVILLLIMIGLCVKIAKQRKELKIAELYQPSSYEVGNLHKKRNEIPLNPYEDVYNPPKPEEKAAFNMPKTSINGSAGQENKGYSPVEPPYDGPNVEEPAKESNLAELMSSGAYKNFTPYLGHIDPRANYSIKRPSYFGGTDDRPKRQDAPMSRNRYVY